MKSYLQVIDYVLDMERTNVWRLNNSLHHCLNYVKFFNYPVSGGRLLNPIVISFKKCLVFEKFNRLTDITHFTQGCGPHKSWYEKVSVRPYRLFGASTDEILMTITCSTNLFYFVLRSEWLKQIIHLICNKEHNQ